MFLRPGGVGRNRGGAPGVADVVHVDLAGPFRLAHVRRVAIRGAGDESIRHGLAEVPHHWPLFPGSDGRNHMKTLAPRRLDEAPQSQLLQHVVHQASRTC